MDEENNGRIFKDAWIAGVKNYYPGTPNLAYLSPWEDMSEWEQQAAITVYGKVKVFIQSGLQSTPPAHIAPEQGGRFIGEAWNVQVYRHDPHPNPRYVADWDDLPEWHRRTDIGIFEAIRGTIE